MSSMLLEVLEETVSKRTNLGLSLQILYNRRDWSIENAALAYSDADSEASLTMTVGLRSRIVLSLDLLRRVAPSAPVTFLHWFQ